MKDIKKIERAFFRFLKEYGVFSRSIFIYKNNLKRTGAPKLYDLFIGTNPSYWIQSSGVFCNWWGTVEGDMFWWGLSLLWQSECIFKEYDENLDIVSSVSLLLHNIDDFNEEITKGQRAISDKQNIIDKTMKFRERLLVEKNKLKELLYVQKK